VEICETVMPSFLISSAEELLSPDQIRHFDSEAKTTTVTDAWRPQLPTRLAVTSGASCPDVLMNSVVEKIASFYGYDQGDIMAGLSSLSLHEPTADVV
jgi:4-hydroxy-3-methylbut-2-enyl diphosphate reductase